MGSKRRHPIPERCPITDEPLHITELTSESGDVRIRGEFDLPEPAPQDEGSHELLKKLAALDEEQRGFLLTFLSARGIISTVERELGISYPTVRARLDALLQALDIEPAKTPPRKPNAAAKRKILKDLEEGAITAAEAKQRLAGGK